MNYRQEIDALLDVPPRPAAGSPDGEMLDYYCTRAMAAEARLALAAKIHAEPHGDGCYPFEASYEVRCTCGKDAAMAEVLG